MRCVAVPDPLVVSRRSEKQGVFAIAKGEQRDLLAHQADGLTPDKAGP